MIIFLLDFECSFSQKQNLWLMNEFVRKKKFVMYLFSTSKGLNIASTQF